MKLEAGSTKMYYPAHGWYAAFKINRPIAPVYLWEHDVKNKTVAGLIYEPNSGYLVPANKADGFAEYITDLQIFDIRRQQEMQAAAEAQAQAERQIMPIRNMPPGLRDV